MSDLIAYLDELENERKESDARRKQRNPHYVKGKKHENFAQYIRSEIDLQLDLKKAFGTSKVTLERIIKLFTEHNLKIVDGITVHVNPKDVLRFKEYSRHFDDKGWTGKMTKAEYEKLKADIAKNGIREPARLTITHGPHEDYHIMLGEGNHRLRIAAELGMTEFPIRLIYNYTSEKIF